MKNLILLILFTGLLTSCGKRAEGERHLVLEGRWQSYEAKCYRELVFLKDQYFQEILRCQDASENMVSTGLWSRSGDNVITMKYVDSERHGDEVEIHAVVDIDHERMIITNLNQTLVFRKVSSKPEYRFPSGNVPTPLPPKDDDKEEACTELIITIDNKNINTNTNTNENTCIDANAQRQRGIIE